jgi:hypothetical protein
MSIIGRNIRRPVELNPVRGEANVEHLNAIDRNGQRYTTHHFARNGDWWRSATILSPSVVERLRRDGLLPLIEVKP